MKLLAQLELQTQKAKRYRTPFGIRARDEGLVRGAMQALADPALRATYARFVTDPSTWSDAPIDAPASDAWPEVWRALWWADGVESGGARE